MAQQDILRVYDAALMKWVEKRVVVPGHELGYHIATPDRPYGFEIPTDPATGTVDTKRAASMLLTPQVSLIRTGLDFDQSRNNTNSVRNLGVWDHEKKFQIQSAAPRPWNISYQLDIVARLRNDIQRAIQFFLYHVDPIRMLCIDFSQPWGEQNVTLRFQRIEDNSDIEAGEGMRYYRYTIPLIVEAWLFGAYDNLSDIPHGSAYPDSETYRSRTIHKIRAIIKDSSDNNRVLAEVDL